jgi:hypothetical protein
VSSVQDVVGSLNANVGQVEEMHAQIAAVIEAVEGLAGALQDMQAEAKAGAAQACLSELQTAAAQAQRLGHELGQARDDAMRLSGG